MALHHASSGELINVRPLLGELATSVTQTLYKTDRLQVFRIVLPAGKGTTLHKVDGELTAQCIEGQVEFAAGATIQVMQAGDLICLIGNIMHGVRAVKDALILVTLLLNAPRQVAAPSSDHSEQSRLLTTFVEGN